MLLLQSSSYINNYRKFGLVVASINLVLQSLFFIVLLIAVAILYQDRYVDGQIVEQDYRTPIRNLIIDGMVFFGIDIFFYLLLIRGIVKRDAGSLLLWLIYSFAEIVIVQGVLLFLTIMAGFTFYIITISLGVLSGVAQILVAMYMFHNMCVIYTLRQDIINSRNVGPPQVNSNMLTITSHIQPCHPCQCTTSIHQYPSTPHPTASLDANY